MPSRAFYTLCISALAWPTIVFARDEVNPEEVWRAQMVSCPQHDRSLEAGATAALTAVLLERAFTMGASAIRSAITKAAGDESRTVLATGAGYLFDRQSPDDGADRNVRRACVVVARGVALAPNQPPPEPGFAVANKTVARAVASDFQALRLEKPTFFAKVAFEPSTDGVAVKPRLMQLYYPKRLETRRPRAPRHLTIGVQVAQPGVSDAFVYAGDITLPNPAVLDTLQLSGLNGMSAAGWAPAPDIDLAAFADVPSGEFFPVNVDVTIVETAKGSAFFKALDSYLDEETTKALTDAAAERVLPARRADAKEARRQAYQEAVVEYFSKRAGYDEACSEYRADPSSDVKRSTAWSAFYALDAAYQDLRDMRSEGTAGPGQEEIKQPTACK